MERAGRPLMAARDGAERLGRGRTMLAQCLLRARRPPERVAFRGKTVSSRCGSFPPHIITLPREVALDQIRKVPILERVETASISQITERIAKACAETPGGVVAFDGDGTLWNGDVGEDFFHALLENADFRAPARAAMESDVAEFGLAITGSALDLARGLYAAYRDGRYPEERTCEMMTWACADWAREEVDAFAEKVVHGLGSRLHGEAIAALEWARDAKIEVLLVSASPRPVVEAAGRVVGIDGAHVFAATPTYDGAIMLPRVVRPIPYGPGKVGAIRAYAKARPLYAAFGDNVFDLAMLTEARVAVAVRPKSRLRERAHEVHGIVEIQPILAP